MAGHKTSRVRVDIRQKEAKERQTKWEELSPAKQLQSLDDRLGVGVGAVKQRKRLNNAKNKS